MLHSEYTTSCFMANKQARQTFHCFVLNSHFIQLSECKYIRFVCLSVRLYPCVSDTLAGDFLSAQLIYRVKVELCHTLYDFHGITEIIFRGRCRPRKLKSAKNNPHVFQTKPRKFGDAKISHYTVWKSILTFIKKSKMTKNCCILGACLSAILFTD